MERTSIEIKDNVLQEDHILADDNLPVQKGTSEGDFKNSHFRWIRYLINGLYLDHSPGSLN